MIGETYTVTSLEFSVESRIALDAVVHISLTEVTGWVALLTYSHCILEVSINTLTGIIDQSPVKARNTRKTGISLTAGKTVLRTNSTIINRVIEKSTRAWTCSGVPLEVFVAGETFT